MEKQIKIPLRLEGVIIEKEYFNKAVYDNSKLFLEWDHKSKESPNFIIGDCEIQEDKVNNVYISNFNFYNDNFIVKNIINLGKEGKLFPSISGVINKNDVGEIVEIKINSVSIGLSNVDPNIPPIDFSTILESYIIINNNLAIKCLQCGLISHNINDVRGKYCDNCHIFH